MITIQAVYLLVGVLFVVFAYLSVRDAANPRRWTTGVFWGLFATSFLAGDFLGDFGNGVLVLTMALIAGFGGLATGKVATTTGEERKAGAALRGNALFLPALIIPLVTVVGTILIKGIELPGLALGPWALIAPYFETKQATLISLCSPSPVSARSSAISRRNGCPRTTFSLQSRSIAWEWLRSR